MLGKLGWGLMAVLALLVPLGVGADVDTPATTPTVGTNLAPPHDWTGAWPGQMPPGTWLEDVDRASRRENYFLFPSWTKISRIFP